MSAMRFAGIDLGSRTIKLVIVDEAGKIAEACQVASGFDALATAKELIEGRSYDQIMATGYGRGLFEVAYDAPTVTEIKAHAVGARHFFPHGLTVLDIGGQDSKAMSLTKEGKVKKFEMNDRCAAGTGKFLEIMAKTLGYEIEEFGPAAEVSREELAISSMCTVFAESEVTSLIAKGEKREKIARGIHLSVVNRASGMLNRVSAEGTIVFTGGVAKNGCICRMLSSKLGRDILVPDDPQIVGALGAALILRAQSMADD